jgi:hypothetical protein
MGKALDTAMLAPVGVKTAFLPISSPQFFYDYESFGFA